MRFALLGADSTTRELARAVVRDPQHELVCGCELGADADEFRVLAPSARVAEEWESLLNLEDVEAVLVSRSSDSERRAEQLRTLVQLGTPLLVSHPVHDSMLLYYELDMIRRESGAVMLPYLPARWHPAVEPLARLFHPDSPGALGRLERIVIDRATAERTREAVLAQFARDVDLARHLAGDLTKLSAMAPAAGPSRYANLELQLWGPHDVLVRWSVRPVEARGEARVSLLASGGTALLTIPDSSAPWRIEVTRSDGTSEQLEAGAWDPAAVALEKLQQAMAGEEIAPGWVDAARSVELTETIDRSLEKGRTIELHYEDYSEEATFKGTMTSLGCGLLVGALVLLPVAAIAARMGFRWARYWAYALLAVLVVFLLLQMLRFVFPKQATEEDESGAGERGASAP